MKYGYGSIGMTVCYRCGKPATSAINIYSGTAPCIGPCPTDWRPCCDDHGLLGGKVVMIREDEYARLKALEAAVEGINAQSLSLREYSHNTAAEPVAAGATVGG